MNKTEKKLLLKCLQEIISTFSLCKDAPTSWKEDCWNSFINLKKEMTNYKDEEAKGE